MKTTPSSLARAALRDTPRTATARRQASARVVPGSRTRVSIRADARASPRVARHADASSSTHDHPGGPPRQHARKVSLAASITRRRARGDGDASHRPSAGVTVLARARPRFLRVHSLRARTSSARLPGPMQGRRRSIRRVPRDGLHRARALAPKHTTHPSLMDRLRTPKRVFAYPRPERRAHHHPGLGRVGRGDGRRGVGQRRTTRAMRRRDGRALRPAPTPHRGAARPRRRRRARVVAR